MKNLLLPHDLFTPAEVVIQPGESAIEFALRVVESVANEPNTDALIDAALGAVKWPWWVPTGVVRMVADKLLPDAIVTGLRALALKLAK